MPYLETSNGIRWHYDLEGEGDALLFIHGWGVDRRIWRQQCKYFSQRYRVLAVDLPGHGKTSWRNVGLGDIAGDVLEVARHAGFPKMDVVASSFGGLVALKMYERDPQPFRSMVFVGSHPKFVRAADYPYGLETVQIRKLAGQLDTDYPIIVNVFFRSLFTRKERASRRFKWIQTFRKTDVLPDREALLNLLNILEREDLRPVFRKLAVPVQFINGAEDYFFPGGLAEYLRDQLPAVRFRWFEHCGHFPFLTRPHEFNRVLDEVLRDGR